MPGFRPSPLDGDSSLRDADDNDMHRRDQRRRLAVALVPVPPECPQLLHDSEYLAHMPETCQYTTTPDELHISVYREYIMYIITDIHIIWPVLTFPLPSPRLILVKLQQHRRSPSHPA